MAEDINVSVGADTTKFIAEIKKARIEADRELKKLKTDISLELNSGQLEQQFNDARKAFFKNIQDNAGQIKFDTIGSQSYDNTFQQIDRVRDQTRAFDREQQRQIVDRMRREAEAEQYLTKLKANSLAKQADEATKNAQYLQRLRANSAVVNQRIAEEQAKAEGTAAKKALDAQMNSYPRLRYALYDVANISRNLSTGLIGFAQAGVTAFAEYEAAFTKVQRTVGSDATSAQINVLRTQLLDLSTEIPLAFGEITEIASLGAQLGVASEDIEAFTDTVAKFAAVTNVTAEAAAQSFGALGELLNVPASEYNKLGSAIAFAGVNAVATEKEILSVSTAIAGVAANAGFSTQYVLGLSTSLASLRVPAEQSRGALTRVFQEISRSAQTGGPSLDEFARVIGTTTEEAKNLANTDIEQFFDRFLNGLSSMDSSELTSSLDRLALSDIRVTNTLARLSNNMDLVGRSMDDVNSSYASGTQLTDAFGNVVDDLNSKFIILSNAFTRLQAAAGAGLGTVLKPIIDTLVNFINTLSVIGESEAGAAVLGIASAIVGLAGAFAAVATAAALGLAGLLAMRTAFLEASRNGDIMNKSLETAIANLLRMPGATGTARAGLKGLGASLIEVGKASGFFSGALRSVAWLAAITAATALATEAFRLFNESQKSAAEKSADLAGSFFGEASGNLSEAFAKDTEAGADALQRISVETKTAGTEAQDWVSDLEKASGAQVGLTDATTDATEVIKNQTVAYDENAKSALASMLANNEAVQELFKAGTFEATGADPDEFFAAILGDPVAGGRKYLESIYAGIQARIGEGSPINFAEMVALEAPGGGYNAAAMVGLLGEELGISAVAAQELLTQYTALDNVVAATTAEVETSAAAYAAQTAATNALNESTEDTAESVEAMRDRFQQYNEDLFETVNAAQETMDALSSLGTVLGEEGDAAAVAGGSLQAAIAAIIDEDPTQAAARLQFLLEYIMVNTPGATATIQYLRNAINDLSGGKPVTAKSFNISGFTKNLKAAGNAAGGAAAKVRTLTDYANDLAKVFDRAFEIRFGSIDALDKVSQGFQKIQEETEDAKQEIKDIRATIDGLTADKKLQEYFLSVAEAYGDSLKASQIRAEIAKIDSDLASENDNLAAAQDKTNKSLLGNSAAAIENRKTIRDIVKDYQDYIQSLANSGASQETLAAATAAAKADFMAQATQLGYNANELGLYATAFDDVQVAISNVPRNVTVTASMDPALQALYEFEAQAKESGSRAGKNYADSFAEEVAPEQPSSFADDRRTSLTGKRDIAADLGFKDAANKDIPFYLQKIKTDVSSSNIAGSITSQKAPIGNAVNGVLGPANTTNAITSFKNNVFGASQSIPDSINGQKTATSNAINGVLGPENTGAGVTSFKSSFDKTAASIPSSISAQKDEVNKKSLDIGKTSGSGINSGLSSNLNIAGTVTNNANAAKSPSETNGSTLGDSLARGMRAGLSLALNAILGVSSLQRTIVKNLTGFSEGGYTGAGGKFEPAGIVHRGEYVVPKSEVNQRTQMPYFMEQPRTFAQGGYVGGGNASAMMVMLSPEDRALLRGVGGSGEVVLYANNEAIARSANMGNKSIVAGGGRP